MTNEDIEMNNGNTIKTDEDVEQLIGPHTNVLEMSATLEYANRKNEIIDAIGVLALHRGFDVMQVGNMSANNPLKTEIAVFDEPDRGEYGLEGPHIELDLRNAKYSDLNPKNHD